MPSQGNQPAKGTSWSSDHTQSDIMPKTLRDTSKVGDRPIYIDPKELSDNDPEDEKMSQSQVQDSIANLQEKLSGKGSTRRFVSHEKIKTRKEILQRQASETNNEPTPNYQANIPPMIYRKVKNNWLFGLELFIFIGFLLGSFPSPKTLAYLDLAANIICALKVIIIHGWLYLYNSRNEKEMAYLKTEGGSKPIILFINRIQKYEFLQIWSILLTPFCMIYLNQPLFGQLFPAIRSFRLLFPILINKKKQEKLRVNILIHVFKIALFTGLFTLVLSIIMGILFNNSSSYHCMTNNHLNQLTDGTIDQAFAKNFKQCGISLQCQGEGQMCRNIYEYAENSQNRQKIDKLMGRENDIANFDQSILNSFLATQGIGGVGFYKNYSPLLFSVLMFAITIVFWLLGTLMAGIGVGETLRSETLEDWQNNQRQCRMNSSKCRGEMRRKSNISFNAEKLYPNQQDIIEEQSLISNVEKSQIEQEIQKINEQICRRPIKAKIFTILFNMFSLSHVILVMLDDLQLQKYVDKNLNIALLVITALWLCGVIIGTIQYSRTSIKVPFQKGILIFEWIGLIFTIIDYIARSTQPKGTLISSTSLLTPLSHGIISLRIVYVIFNNGFSAYYSYYAEKMVANFWRNKRVVGIIFLLGVSIGFAQAHIAFEETFEGCLGKVNNSLGMILGTGGGMMKTDLGQIFFASLKILGFIIGLYIAKHFNLGYDTLMDMQLGQEYEKTVEEIKVLRSIPSLNLFGPEKCFRTTCFRIHKSMYYHYAKILIICSYTIISLIYDPTQRSPLSAILLILDIYLIIDIIAQIVAYGLLGANSYMKSLASIKTAYIMTQVYLIITFFIPHLNYAPVITFFRCCRLWIILCYFQKLTDVLNTMMQIFFHPKLQIYRVYLFGIPLTIMGMAITSRYALAQQKGIRAMQLIINGLKYAYGMGWDFANEETAKVVKDQSMSILTMNIGMLVIIIFFHVLSTFMIVTYFVNKRVKNMGEINEQVLNLYGSANPDNYNHVVYRYPSITNYIKYLKLGIMFASLICLCLLVGDTVSNVKSRIGLATFNLILVLSSFLVFLLENLWLKTYSDQKWPLAQTVFLILSIPGAFLLVAPIVKYSSNSPGLRATILIFQMLSALHLFNIFSLITKRSGQPFTSRIWRRVFTNIPFEQFGYMAILMLFLTLPFAGAISSQNSTNIWEQILATLSGGYFRDSPQSAFQLLIKIIAIMFIYLPCKVMMLARIISSFLSNNPNYFTSLHDRICEVIVQNGVLNQEQKSLHFLNNNYYRITKKLCSVFSQFSSEDLKVQTYKDVDKIYRRINTPIFYFQDESEKKGQVKYFGTFLYDIIYGIYLLSKHQIRTQNNQVIQFQSLYQMVKPRQQHVFRTHIKSQTLSVMTKCKNRLKSGMNRAIKRANDVNYQKSRISKISNSRVQ